MFDHTPIDAAQRVDSLFASWVGEDSSSLELENHSLDNLSFKIRVGGIQFVAIMRSLADTPTIAAVLHKFEREPLEPGIHPLIVVPYMGEVGDRLCREAGVAWMDLSGNARIQVGNLFIHVSGNPNEFKRVGRPSNAFAAKSSRITRYLLQHPNDSFLQAELAEATGLDPGYTSKIVHRLEERREDRIATEM